MIWLVFIVHLFLGTTLAGSAIVIALTLGHDTLMPILVAAVIGFVAGLPISWMVAKKLLAGQR